MVDAQFIEKALSNLDLPVETRDRLHGIGISHIAAEGGVHPALLLEFGALALLEHWNSQGQLEAVDGLPSVVDAAQELIDRAETVGLDGDGAFALFIRVCEVYLDQFAWGARDLVGCDIVLGDLDEDAIVDALAEFLWENRHQARPANCAIPSGRNRDAKPLLVPDYEMIARLERNEEN